MNIPLLLEQENIKNKWSNEDAARIAQMDVEHYLEILTGSIKPDYEDALRLSAAYQIPASLFLSSEESKTFINTGTGTYTNTVQGYIGTYINVNHADEGLRELFKDLLENLDLSQLRKKS